MKVLAVVPARSGSKGYPNKNLAEIGNTTLLELAVKVGMDCKIVKDVFISTDSMEYEKKAIAAGAKSLGMRPRKLSTDTAKSVDVIADLLEKIENNYDYIVLLQPTSPIREPQDIENMIKIIQDKNADACVSVTKIEEPHPYKLKKIGIDGYVKSFIKRASSELPRQLLPRVYALNGAIYVAKTKIILKENTFLPKKTIPYFMNSNINIDSDVDHIFLEAMVKKKKVKLWNSDV